MAALEIEVTRHGDQMTAQLEAVRREREKALNEALVKQCRAAAADLAREHDDAIRLLYECANVLQAPADMVNVQQYYCPKCRCADCGNTLQAPANAPWTCKASRTSDPPQDCNWPVCGCDPYADKVIEALLEADLLKPAKRAAGLDAALQAPANGMTDEI